MIFMNLLQHQSIKSTPMSSNQQIQSITNFTHQLQFSTINLPQFIKITRPKTR